MGTYIGLPLATGFAHRFFGKRSRVAVASTLADVADTLTITQTSSDATYEYFDVQVKDAGGANRAGVFLLHGWQSLSSTVPSYQALIYGVVTGYQMSGYPNPIATNASGLANLQIDKVVGSVSYLWVFYAGKGFVSGAIAAR